MGEYEMRVSFDNIKSLEDEIDVARLFLMGLFEALGLKAVITVREDAIQEELILKARWQPKRRWPRLKLGGEG